MQTERIDINDVRKEDCEDNNTFDQRKQIRRFMVQIPWAKDDQGDGIAWRELYLLYRLHGWNSHTEQENR